MTSITLRLLLIRTSAPGRINLVDKVRRGEMKLGAIHNVKGMWLCTPEKKPVHLGGGKKPKIQNQTRKNAVAKDFSVVVKETIWTW